MLTTAGAHLPNSRSGAGISPRGEARHAVALKRVRDTADSNDGTRVLVDRLWPRGVHREALIIDLWLKNVAPSTDLRRWYGHDPRKWTTFIEKYRAELHRHEDLLHLLGDLRTRGRLTLLCDARDTSHSHGVVLREVLTERRFLRQIPKGVTS